VISPARFAIGRAFVESAEMGPAIRIRGSGGLVPAKTLTAAGAIKPDSDPSAGRLVVQNYRITKGIVEGALTVGLGKTGESFTAFRQAAVNHDGASSQIFLPVNAQTMNLGTVKPGRNEWVDGGLCGHLIFLLRLCSGGSDRIRRGK